MTITLDGKTLNVTSFSESVEPVAVEWDTWENGQYKRKYKAYGAVKTWTLECIEENVAWTNSAAKQFQEKAASGEQVTFIVDEGTRHQINTNVYILNVDLILELVGTQNLRRFTIKLQETTCEVK